MRKRLAFFVSLLISACDSSSENNVLRLSLSGVEPLLNGFHYEGWAIIDGNPRTTGKFNVSTSGALVTLAGAPIANGEFETDLDLDMATAIVITIEPNGDTDDLPTATHYLAGPVSGSSAALSVGAPEALGNDFQSAAGVYILATPTDEDNANELSGLWFIDPSGASPVAGLVLPALPAGWKYEGWAVVDELPLSTGRFTSPSGADEAAPFSGPLAGPPFPGEDWLRNAPSGLTFPLDLSGQMAVITIEPEPDDAPAPFTLKPLVGTAPADAIDHTSYPLTNQAAGFPTGTATLP